MALPHIDCDR